jgi:hypothetical protein
MSSQAANLYSKYSGFTPTQLSYVDAKYYSSFYTASGYPSYVSNLKTLYQSKETLLVNYK